MRGMVFGVFDGLHEGHKRFLSDAYGRTTSLVVVVARDVSTRARKGKMPKMSEAERVKAVSDYLKDATVVLGDEHEGSWHVIDEHDPERVFLGYDQGEMSRELKRMGIPFTFLDAYEPGKCKSSKL